MSPRDAQAALRAEIVELAARDAWRGVEANYETLLDIAPRGVRLQSGDHRLAARAALSRGTWNSRSVDWRSRRRSASTRRPMPSGLTWRRDLLR